MTRQTDHEQLAVVRTTATVFEAQTLAAVLEDAGIEAIVLESDALGFPHDSSLPAGGGQVRVRGEDQARAAALLEANAAESTAVRWEDVDVGPRDDDLPLKEPGRTPIAARITFVIAVIVVAVTIVAGAIALFVG